MLHPGSGLLLYSTLSPIFVLLMRFSYLASCCSLYTRTRIYEFVQLAFLLVYLTDWLTGCSVSIRLSDRLALYLRFWNFSIVVGKAGFRCTETIPKRFVETQLRHVELVRLFYRHDGQENLFYFRPQIWPLSKRVSSERYRHLLWNGASYARL